MMSLSPLNTNPVNQLIWFRSMMNALRIHNLSRSLFHLTFNLLRFLIISVIIGIITFLSFSCSGKNEVSQWRGPNRDGIYPEKDLLQEWPEKGPELLWIYEGLGAGHGSVSFSKDKIFLLGMPDTMGILYALDLEGKLLWKKEYGEEWHKNYTGPRSTPTIVGDLMYFMSGQGEVFCYNVDSGEKVWSLDILEKFDAKNITWGMAESILIDGDRLFCTPGGEENNMVALNRFTGETIWTSPGNRQQAAYCSPIMIRHHKSDLIVTMTSESIIGVDANTGQFYWQVPQFQNNLIHANTPVYSKGIIYCSSQQARKHQSGLVALSLSDDGKEVEVVWRNEDYGNLMGGILIKDDYIYGSRYRKNIWNCINTADGKILYDIEGLAEGVIIYADGLFYCYTSAGEMALVDASPESFKIISRFNITYGTDQHWAHPVIHEGRLYVRHGNALGVYDIRKK